MFTFAHQLTLHYQVEGPPNGLPLVFINSLGCDLTIWDEMAQPFSEKYRVIRYDKRGHGLSDAPPGPYTLREHALDLEALLDDLAVDRFVLVGLSVGGLIAMDYALLHPERLLGLALADTAPKIGTSEFWDERIRVVRERGLADLAETIVSRWFVPSFVQRQPAQYQGSLNMLARTPLEGYLGTCAVLRDADLRSDVQHIAAPTLVLCGSGDPVVSPDQTREWAVCLPQARVVVIDDAAHLPCIEQPDAVRGALGTFLREDCHAG